MTFDDFYDPKKRGTLIISHYRSGSHYVSNNLAKMLKSRNVACTELGEVSSVEQVIAPIKHYKIALVNSVLPKVPLVRNQDLIKDYHIVRLTRNNKIQHWISEYIWRYHNNVEQRFDDTNFPHHGGKSDLYKNFKPVEFSLGNIEYWLLEQLPINLFKVDVDVDYSELSVIDSPYIQWEPNQYNLTLGDLFSNYKEIEDYLTPYNVPKIK